MTILLIALGLFMILGLILGNTAWVRPNLPFKENPWKWDDATSPQFTVGALTGGNTITVNVVLYQDRQQPIGVYPGNPVATTTALQWYISSDSAGQTPATASGGVTAGTNGAILQTSAGEYGMCIPNRVNGEVDFVIVESVTENLYLNIVLPTGGVVTSPILAF